MILKKYAFNCVILCIFQQPILNAGLLDWFFPQKKAIQFDEKPAIDIDLKRLWGCDARISNSNKLCCYLKDKKIDLTTGCDRQNESVYTNFMKPRNCQQAQILLEDAQYCSCKVTYHNNSDNQTKLNELNKNSFENRLKQHYKENNTVVNDIFDLIKYKQNIHNYYDDKLKKLEPRWWEYLLGISQQKREKYQEIIATKNRALKYANREYRYNKVFENVIIPWAVMLSHFCSDIKKNYPIFGSYSFSDLDLLITSYQALYAFKEYNDVFKNNQIEHDICHDNFEIEQQLDFYEKRAQRQAKKNIVASLAGLLTKKEFASEMQIKEGFKKLQKEFSSKKKKSKNLDE